MSEMLPFHPLANLFPLMEGREFTELVDDIREHGLREPIVVLDGQVLDGRNRLRACIEAEVPYELHVFDEANPLAFVMSVNMHRRHLDESQRAMVAAKVANMPSGYRSDIEPSANLQKVSQPDAAKMLHVSPRSVASATAVRQQGTQELIEKVERGTVSVSAAADVATLPKTQQSEIVAKGEREILEAAKRIRSERAIQRRTENDALKATTVAAVPNGRYSTIVIDPPWDMQKIERDVRPNQVEFDYPTMTEDELRAFPVPGIAADDCHMFCWTTHKFLPSALRLMEAWGFRYVLTMVWHKNGGFQPIGLPQYNCEFAVYGRKGSPEFVDTKAFNACFYGERREHSRKPDEFYDVIRRVTGPSRIDVFSREPREGFEQFGNEAGKFAA